VPPEIMGIVEPGASRATIERANYIFAKWVLEPRLEMFRALLQERLVPEYDDRLIVSYVSPVEDDKEFRLQVGQAAPWSWRVDEWRELAGMPEIENGGGKVFMLPLSLDPVETIEPQEPGPIPPGLAPFANTPPNPDDADDPKEDPDAFDEDGEPLEENDDEARIWRAVNRGRAPSHSRRRR